MGHSTASGRGVSAGQTLVKNAVGEEEYNNLTSFNPGFAEALAKAKLTRNADGEIAFRFYGRDKRSGTSKLMDIYASDKKTAQDDIRGNGYSVSRLLTKDVYDAFINHTDGETWLYRDAQRVDNALLKRR